MAVFNAVAALAYNLYLGAPQRWDVPLGVKLCPFVAGLSMMYGGQLGLLRLCTEIGSASHQVLKLQMKWDTEQQPNFSYTQEFSSKIF